VSPIYVDDPENYDGAPVGVQIVARRYEEEKIWAIGKIVYDCLQQWQGGMNKNGSSTSRYIN
jgi:amidase